MRSTHVHNHKDKQGPLARDPGVMCLSAPLTRSGITRRAAVCKNKGKYPIESASRVELEVFGFELPLHLLSHFFPCFGDTVSLPPLCGDHSILHSNDFPCEVDRYFLPLRSHK